MLKPQDVLAALKLVCLAGKEWSFKDLGSMIGLSGGEAHRSIGRLKASGLVYEKDDGVKVANKRLLDFLVYGVPQVFYPLRGAVSRGMLTGYSATPLAEKIVSGVGEENAIPLVWPTADGKSRGETLTPIYETVPEACMRDKGLYELLVLVDGVRVGKTRDKKTAAEMLEKRLLPKVTGVAVLTEET